jgi:gamma-glutamylcyclotransferase (GGCT)/AIG2-like uncharacterized protein YtfP
MLYLAYGSNLHTIQMKNRCPAAKPLYAFDLPDWELVFRSVADIVPAPGKSVPVAVWDISEKCEAALDRYEGVASGMYRKEYIELDEGPALVYLMNSKDVYPPGSFYYSTIEQGYRQWGHWDGPLVDAFNATL